MMENRERIIQWTKGILREVSKLDKDKGIDILKTCGEECSRTSPFPEGIDAIRQELGSDEDPDTLFKAFQSRYYNSPNLRKEGDEYILIFKECTCPIVKAGVRDPFICHCTVGYTEKIFKQLFNKGVTVKLEQSILKGDAICKQVITITA